jgi:cell division protein FtsZ
MVAEDDDGPLFGETVFEDRRPQKTGGFLSLFGSRPRYDAPAAPASRPAAVRGSAQPIEAPASQAQADAQEDLEIPSFLRRLAN